MLPRYEAGASVAVAPVEALLTATLATAASVEPNALPSCRASRKNACAMKRTERRSAGAFPVAKVARARGASAEDQEGVEARRHSYEE